MDDTNRISEMQHRTNARFKGFIEIVENLYHDGREILDAIDEALRQATDFTLMEYGIFHHELCCHFGYRGGLTTAKRKRDSRQFHLPFAG